MQTKKEEKIEKKIKINFKDKKLLHQAFIHKSYLNEHKSEQASNERLEFLGDAVIEFVVSNHLYRQFPNFTEGKLTTLRANLVNTKELAKLAKDLRLGEMLYLSKGEEKEGKTNPSLLANTFEALVGAIFLDQGLETAEMFLERFLLKNLASKIKKPLKDAKSLLQEKVQELGLHPPVYKTIREEGPDHAKKFTVQVVIGSKPSAIGTGSSKQAAEQNAANKALKKFRKES